MNCSGSWWRTGPTSRSSTRWLNNTLFFVMSLSLSFSLSTPTDPQYKYYANLLQVTSLPPSFPSADTSRTVKTSSSLNSRNIPAHDTLSATVTAARCPLPQLWSCFSLKPRWSLAFLSKSSLVWDTDIKDGRSYCLLIPRLGQPLGWIIMFGKSLQQKLNIFHMELKAALIAFNFLKRKKYSPVIGPKWYLSTAEFFSSGIFLSFQTQVCS